jgi:hypothetical protein
MVWCCTSLVKRAFETVLLIHVMTEFFTPFFVESNSLINLLHTLTTARQTGPMASRKRADNQQTP